MGLRKPRTINEELVAELSPDARPASARRRRAESRLRQLALGLAVALVLVGVKLGVDYLPASLGLAVGALVVIHYFSFFARSTRRNAHRGGRILRAFLLVWLAICVVATVLVALGGFQMEDRAVLGFVWPILGLTWVGYRLRVAAASPRPGTGSSSPSR